MDVLAPALFPINCSVMDNPAVTLLFRSSLEDAGLFHAILACAARHLIGLSGNNLDMEREAIGHQTRAVRYLHDAIQDPARKTSDLTIGSILCMGAYEVNALRNHNEKHLCLM